MRSPRSPSCSNSSSSNYSVSATSLRQRLKTIFKKADELSILCGIEMCVIHYGPDGKLETWPKERNKAEDIALRYIRLDKSQRRKKSVNLHGFLKKKKNQLKKQSPEQISQLILSYQRNLSTLQERLRFVEKEKKKTNLENQNLTPSSPNDQPLQNPNQFSLLIYNHGDASVSQLPLSASNFTQLTSYLESGLLNNQALSGFDQNNNFQQHPCVSNTQNHSGYLQESMNNYGLDQLMQQELYGFNHNMCASSDITTNSNVVDPCLSNTLFQDPYGYMVGSTSSSFSQEFPLPSTLPSLSTIPNSYLLSHNNNSISL